MLSSQSQSQTKTDRDLENRILAVQGDDERVQALTKARAFKRSWIELAEILTRIFDRGSWEPWGFSSFEDYCKQELHIGKSTAVKLLGTFSFLKTSAPKIIERAHKQPNEPIPSVRAIDFVARAEKRGAADPTTLGEIRKAAFDEGIDAPTLTKRFKEVAFPVSGGERKTKLVGQLSSTGKRLAALIADPECPLDKSVAASIEAAVGKMLAQLHKSGGRSKTAN